jgi:ABC-type sugar transport system ATPase subunit
VADRVTVLKDGESKGTWWVRAAGPAKGEEPVTIDRLIEVMAGHALSQSIEHTGPSEVEPVLAVRDLTREGEYEGVSYELRPGEILGFFGLVGAGRTEVAHAVFGIMPAQRGEIRIKGRTERIHSPRRARRLGIAYLPEDRKGQGLFGNLSVGYNVTITIVRRLTSLGFVVQRRQEDSVARQDVSDFGIKTPNVRVRVANLSGGNQQKVVVAKWLSTRPDIFILDEPTAGVDVAAKQEIHNLIADLARQGVAIMLISSELPEILKLSDRIITMYEGRVTGEFPRGTPAHAVLAAAMGEGGSRARPATA